MATIGATNLNLTDWGQRVDPKGTTAKITEIISETNEILLDMTWEEGNLATGHLTTVRSGLPTVTWRLLNYGTQTSKSRTIQVIDTCGQLTALAEIDKKLADLNGNTAEFRASEDKAFIEGMSQEMASTLFYGNTATDPEKFMGLTPRYNDSNADDAANILTGDGTGSDNTSVWLVTWDSSTCHGIFPKGSKAGLETMDRDLVMLEDTQSPAGKYPGYQTYYSWDCGLTLRDWRYVVRIANISISNLTKNAATGSDLIDLMIQAIELLPSTRGRRAFYCNQTIKSFLRRQIRNSTNVNLTLDQVAGRHVLAFDDIPVRRCDALLNNEDLYS